MNLTTWHDKHVEPKIVIELPWYFVEALDDFGQFDTVMASDLEPFDESELADGLESQVLPPEFWKFAFVLSHCLMKYLEAAEQLRPNVSNFLVVSVEISVFRPELWIYIRVIEERLRRLIQDAHGSEHRVRVGQCIRLPIYQVLLDGRLMPFGAHQPSRDDRERIVFRSDDIVSLAGRLRVLIDLVEYLYVTALLVRMGSGSRPGLHPQAHGWVRNLRLNLRRESSRCPSSGRTRLCFDSRANFFPRGPYTSEQEGRAQISRCASGAGGRTCQSETARMGWRGVRLDTRLRLVALSSIYPPVGSVWIVLLR